VRRALRVVQECSRKPYAESASNARAYGNSGGIQTIFDDLSLTLRETFPNTGLGNRLANSAISQPSD
jgi:hypothetical protein